MIKKEWNFYNAPYNWSSTWEWSKMVDLCKKIDEKYNWGISKKLVGKSRPGELNDNDIVDNIPDNFCVLPFSRLQIDPDGRAKPCCKYKNGVPPDLNDYTKLPNKNLDELWNQDEFVILRDQFMKNERPEGCKVCWEEEASGMKSLRQIVQNGAKINPRYNVFVKIPSQSPDHLDLKLSNLCNLKCRICTPFLSSQWIKEHKDLNLADDNVIKIYTNNSREKLFEDSYNEELLKQWAPGITDIEFYGGEPLLQQEHSKVLELITTYGNPEVLRFFYNSNSTQFDASFFKYWEKCQFITINFSVDDIEDRFEYQRKNAVYDEVFKNLTLFVKHAEQHKLKYEFNIYNTVGMLNVLYLPEFLKEAEKFNLQVWLNLVHYPDHFNIKNLPKEVKEIIKQKLETINYSNIKFNKDSISVKDIINFMMMNEADPSMIKRFYEVVRLHDGYRKESFEQTFPELHELLTKYEI
jgi:sulfatase maturation enzyme AslB (radical SAM superfamily)